MILSRDAFYTPGWLAKMMAEALPCLSGVAVADFAAGGGALLEAAERRFGDECNYVATDVDLGAVTALRVSHPRWQVGRLDLLRDRSRRASPLWRMSVGEVGGVLLNPPFSYRGGAGVVVELGGVSTRISPAAAFVERALEAVAMGGNVVALLPQNSPHSERDRAAWSYWRSRHHVEVLDAFGRTVFAGARAGTVLVRLTKDGSLASRAEALAAPPPPVVATVDLVRGRVPVHSLGKQREGGVPFLHTTDVRSGRVLEPRRFAQASLASGGPFVLVPRVGKPDRGKLAAFHGPAAVLSDCLFALRPTGGVDLEGLVRLLFDGFSLLERGYAGSCAPYLTVRSLSGVLREVGVSATQVAASHRPA